MMLRASKMRKRRAAVDNTAAFATVNAMLINETARRFRFVSLICASLSIVLGVLTLAGWISGLALLASVRAKYIPMAPSTALCFALIGAGVFIVASGASRTWISRAAATIVLLVALAKLIEFGGGFHFGIDSWFVRNPHMFGSVPTGRMSPITALDFVVVAAGLVALTIVRARRWAGPLGVLTTAVGAIVLIGYWYGTPLLYGGTIIPVAFSTAFAFVFSGVALMSATGIEQWPLRLFHDRSTRALLLRTFVPLVIAAALVNGWISTTLLRHLRANPAVIAAFCALGFMALVGWIISQVALVVGGRIDRAEEERNAAQKELVALNSELETRVQERTRELRDKNQQMAEELRMARELQLALLPQQFPTVPANVATEDSALRFLSLYFPTGQVSGDFFSVFAIGDQAAGVFICDVMGHGVRSALITSMIRGLVEEHARATTDPGELLTRVNYALTAILKQAATTMFATCFYLVADVGKSELRFANAGHPCALHIRSRVGGGKTAERKNWTGDGHPSFGQLPNNR